MKKLILFFTLILSGFIFSQDRKAEFIEGEKQLKKLIYSKISVDSLDIDEDTVIKLIKKER